MKKFQIKKKNNKFGARKTRCYQGHVHPSRGEAIHCNKVELRRKAGEIKGYDYEKPYKLKVNNKLVCIHKPDFTVYGNNGETWIEEFKGVETKIFKLKKKLFEILYPNINYIIIYRD